MNLGGLFEERLFLYIGWILLLGLITSLVIAIINKRDSRRWAVIAGVFGGILAIIFAASTFSILTLSPKLEFSKPIKHEPYLGTAYVSIMVSNKGEKVAKNCAGEIVVIGLNAEPLKVVWEGGTESKDILPYGGNERLYFLVADPEKIPVRVVPHYPAVFKPPRPDDPWLLKPGNYNLQLSVRSENSRPESVQLILYVGQKWEDLKCNLK